MSGGESESLTDGERVRVGAPWGRRRGDEGLQVAPDSAPRAGTWGGARPAAMLAAEAGASAAAMFAMFSNLAYRNYIETKHYRN